MALRRSRLPGQSDGLSGTNLARAGDYNQRVVLQAIRARGAVTRGELAAITGLTHQSTINIGRRLIAEGLVVDIGRDTADSGPGQPATRLAINGDGAYALGLNIDRDHITLVLMNLEGKVVDRVYLGKPFALPDEVLEFTVTAADELIRRRRVARKRVAGLGIAIPERLGGVDVAARPPAYDGWATLDLEAAFSRALNLPVFAENDATAAAIGESQFGQGLRHMSFVYTLISAGIGCGLVINGQPYAGGLAHAGEIGNIPVHLADGAPHTLWDVVSLYGLYAELKVHGVTVARPEDLNPDDPAQQPGIDAWIGQAAGCMIEPFLAITYVLSPEVHFIGGQLPAFIVRRLCDALNARLPAFQRNVPLTPFVPSTTSVDASALGAAVLVFQNRFLPRPEVLRTAR